MMNKTSGTRDDKSSSHSGGSGSEYVSTIEILHQHTVGATRTEKWVLPVVLLIIAALAAGVFYVVWDHKSRDYRVASTVGDVLRMAEAPLPASGGLGGLINPSDDQYVAVTVKSWQYWAGKGGVTANHFVHLPALKLESLEALVKGDRGAAALTFHLDLSKSSSPEFHVIEVVRAGVVLPDDVGGLELYPLPVADKPAIVSSGAEGGHQESHNVVWDREGTFQKLGKFIVLGRLQKNEAGFWIQAKTYNVALAPGMDPGLHKLLEDIAGTRRSESVTFFLELAERTPPAEREKSHFIGTARLDGADFGKFYVANRS